MFNTDFFVLLIDGLDVIYQGIHAVDAWCSSISAIRHSLDEYVNDIRCKGNMMYFLDNILHFVINFSLFISGT